MRLMGGLRGIGIAMLVLAAAIATPTFSAAQDPAAPAAPPPPTTPPAPVQVEPPAEPAAKEPAKEKPEAEKEQGQDDAAPAQVQMSQQQQTTVAQAGGGGNQATIAASASISTGDNFYSPASVTVAVGDTVNWRNTGQAQHSATANDGSFDTGVFGPGQSRAHTFNTAGSFSYFCTVHGQSQSGTVRVLAASGGGGGGGGGGAETAQSEAAAVASPDAAGTSTTLPATGFAAFGLALIGLVLLASGHVVKRLDRETEDRRLFSIY
jgi:plastocyanin